jgi:hypothetical protein
MTMLNLPKFRIILDAGAGELDAHQVYGDESTLGDEMIKFIKTINVAPGDVIRVVEVE